MKQKVVAVKTEEVANYSDYKVETRQRESKLRCICTSTGNSNTPFATYCIVQNNAVYHFNVIVHAFISKVANLQNKREQNEE